MNTTPTPAPSNDELQVAHHQSSVQIRPEVMALPRYVPGQAMVGAVKLSSNENPFPCQESVIRHAADALSVAHRYPDLTAGPVRASLSEHLGITQESICVGAGSSAVLLAVLMAIGGPESEIIFPWRSFESYPIVIPAVGAKPIPVPLTAQWEHDLPAMLSAITPATRAIILCSPNNPTGTAMTLPQIEAFVQAVPSHILVIVDEAYIEFSTRSDVRTSIPLIHAFPHLFILRTFSKAYGLAGLRVGYGVGNPTIISAVQAVSIPFGVSGPAQTAACAALGAHENIMAAVLEITNERERMTKRLRALGWNIPDSQSNFLWIPHAPRELFEHLRDGGILVRPFPEGIRITIGTAEENDRVIALMTSFIP